MLPLWFCHQHRNQILPELFGKGNLYFAAAIYGEGEIKI